MSSTFASMEERRMIAFFAASFDITADLFSGSKEEKERRGEINVDRFVSREREKSVTTRESEIMIGCRSLASLR